MNTILDRNPIYALCIEGTHTRCDGTPFDVTTNIEMISIKCGIEKCALIFAIMHSSHKVQFTRFNPILVQLNVLLASIQNMKIKNTIVWTVQTLHGIPVVACTTWRIYSRGKRYVRNRKIYIHIEQMYWKPWIQIGNCNRNQKMISIQIRNLKHGVETSTMKLVWNSFFFY